MKRYLSIITFIFLILGIIAGIYMPDFLNEISFIGDYYISILKIFIGPVIFLSIASTIYKTSIKKDRLILKSIITFVVMFIMTFLLTSLIVTIINPSKGLTYESDYSQIIEFDIGKMIINLFPKNLNDIFINPKLFFIIVVAYLFGKTSSHFKADKMFEVIDKIYGFISKIFEYFIYITPLAVFVLIGAAVAKNGTALLSTGLKYVLVAWVCGIICLFVVMILPVYFISKMSPLEYIKKIYRIWMISISTCSSVVCLPHTLKICKEELKIDESISDVVVPLGCTIHMCGGAVSFSLLGLFCAGLYGIDINIYTYILMIISSLLINMAAPGIPGGGIVIGASYLQLLGIPLGFIGFYSGIYKFLDMCYTTLNVTGDISANMIINSLEYRQNKSS